MSNTETTFQNLSPAPQWIKEKLGGHLEEGEQAFCFVSDMTLEGYYVPEALAVTDHRVMVINAEQDGILRQVPLDQVALVKLKRFMGNGILVLTTWNENVEMLRYSSSLSSEIEGFKEDLEQYLMSRLAWQEPGENEHKVEHKDEEETTAEAAETARRCPKCGQLLPPDRDICSACMNKRAILSRMLSYVKPYKFMAGMSLALAFAMAGMACLLPRLSRTLIDEAIGKGDLALLKLLVVILAGIFLARAAIAAVRKLLMPRLAQNIIYDLRSDVYAHLQKLSLSFHDKQSTGRLISRVVSDTAELQSFVVTGLQQFLVDVLMLAIVLCWMMSYSIKLTLMLWLPLPIFYYLIKWYAKNVHKVYRKVFQKRALMSGHLSDTIPGIELVKAFSQEDRVINEFNKQCDGYRTEYLKAVMFSAKFTATFMLLTQIGTLLVYWLGGQATIAGDGFTTGKLVMFIGWIAMMYAPVERFGMLAQQFEYAATSAERVFDVLDTEAIISSNENGHALDKVREEIRFENVSFHYNGGPPVLKDVSFTVKAGETVGLVGPSGSGKSTLIKLLCRFYDASGGRILIDGHDLASINLASYRKMMSIVAQSPFLFRDSILENIRYGRPDATREEVIRAARIANAHDFIMQLPEAYDTDARERGSRFSGGERQRICIARAILKDPSILILDEATSSVDTKNEKLIQDALERVTKNRTTFVIAHRLSTLRNADKIIMMKQGQIVDIGTHEELMGRCEPYRELVEAQSRLGDHVKQDVA